MWTPAFACLDCHAPLTCTETTCLCPACGATFARTEGIFRFAESALPAASRFLAQYRLVRDADGHGAHGPDEFRRLPDVPPTHPHAAEWRIRRESFETLCRRLRLADGVPRRVLDVGAGNGWLSNRLTALGHTAVAVDLNEDPRDGLLACRAYAGHVAAVQADFDVLPFLRGQFDLIVFNASLHYSAAPGRTLQAANRLVADGGALVVMDSPMFVDESDGEGMVEQQLADLHRRYAVTWPLRPGAGFLTFDTLQQVTTQLGRRARFVSSHGPTGWRLRRLWSRRRLRRAPAAFGVWVAR